MKRNIRKEFIAKGFDQATYAYYWKKNKAQYLRKKLAVVCLYASGLGISKIHQKTGHSLNTIHHYLKIYLEGGFALLCQKQQQPRSSWLSDMQLGEFKHVVLNRCPQDYGITEALWTGQAMIDFIYLFYGITYKKGIYSLLSRLGLSHQKAHQDYAESDALQAKEHLQTLHQCLLQADEQTAVVFFDEFSVTETPSTARAWAEKNTRPKVATRQKKDDEPTPC